MAELAESYDIDAVAKQWVGVVVGASQGRYPVEYDAIRRYCHMTADSNPLFLDPAYARRMGHANVVCPPLLTAYFARQGEWPPSRESATGGEAPNFTMGVPIPGKYGINLKTSWQFFAHAVVGDWLNSETSIANVFMKPLKLDPKAVWIVSETKITNQDNVLVASFTNTVVTHRAPEDVSGDRPGES